MNLVFLTRNLLTEESFVYMTSSDHRVKESTSAYPGRTVSWTSFAFDYAPVTVTVHTLRDFKTCTVLPSRYRIACSRAGANQATFGVGANRTTMSVEFDNDQTGPDKDVTDKLFIFADAPESSVPSKDDPSVLYYDVGMHDLNGQLAIPEGVKEVYLAPGAFVEGGFITTSSHPVTIHGRGVLDARNYTWHDDRFRMAMITMLEGSNHTVEGITLSDPTEFFLHALSDYVTISNVKTLGAWVYNNDGFTLGFGGVVTDSFVHANDDSIKLYSSNVTVTRCVVWQAQNGAVFQFGWWPTRTVHFIQVSYVDVIHVDWCTFRGDNCDGISDNDAVFDLAGNTTLFNSSYMTFTEIHVEGYCPRIFNFRFPDEAKGVFADVTFQNLQIDSQYNPNRLIYNVIAGSGKAGRVENWGFLNFVISERCVSDPSKSNFLIGNGSTSNIFFECPEKYQ
nr:hypothetical protein BaRGS_028908 [Batillaria attramentaria]